MKTKRKAYKSIIVPETLKNEVDSVMRENGLKTYREVLECYVRQNKKVDKKGFENINWNMDSDF